MVSARKARRRATSARRGSSRISVSLHLQNLFPLLHDVPTPVGVRIPPRPKPPRPYPFGEGSLGNEFQLHLPSLKRRCVSC